MPGAAAIAAPGDWLRLVLGLLAVYAPCAWAAEALRSTRGEWGLAIAALALALLVLVGIFLFKDKGAHAIAGLRRPAGRGLAAGLAISAALLLVIPLFAMATGAHIAVRADAAWLALGLFAQAGVFEEALFRGYLYGRIRHGRPFWRAALLSAVPFIAVHLWLFAAFDPVTAGLSVALALAISFPLARLYDLGGATIWAPALVHAAVQGGLKVIDTAPEAFTSLTLVWFAACFLLPWLVFAVPQNKTGGVAAAGSSSS